jgi:hypothetical protein
LVQTELSGTLGVSQDQTLITNAIGIDSYNISTTGVVSKTIQAERSDNEHIPCVLEDKCLNPWDVQSKHIQPENGIAEALYSGECRGGGGESYVIQGINGDISGTLDSSYYKGCGERQGVEREVVFGVDQQGGKGMAAYSEDISPTMASDSHGTPHAVCYGISAYESNAMKSNNPNSGIYEADTSRTLDLNGGSPACNQGGMAVVYNGSSVTSPINASNPKEGDPCHTLTDDSRNYVIQGVDGYNLSTSEMSPTLMCQRTDTKNVPSVVCIEGNGQRESHKGDGYKESETMYTLNTVEQHGVAVLENQSTDENNTSIVVEPKCIGNEQLAQLKESDKVGTLNCMHDQQAVLTYGLDRASFNQGKNAQFDFSVEEELAQPIVARGPGGGTEELADPLCARDYKGVGTQYVNEGKCIVSSICSGESSG